MFVSEPKSLGLLWVFPSVYMSIHMEKCPRSVYRGFKTAASSWSHSTVVLVYSLRYCEDIGVQTLPCQNFKTTPRIGSLQTDYVYQSSF